MGANFAIENDRENTIYAECGNQKLKIQPGRTSEFSNGTLSMNYQCYVKCLVCNHSSQRTVFNGGTDGSTRKYAVARDFGDCNCSDSEPARKKPRN